MRYSKIIKSAKFRTLQKSPRNEERIWQPKFLRWRKPTNKNSRSPMLNTILLLYKTNIGRHEFNNISNLSAISFSNNDLLISCQHFENLHYDIKERFQVILNMNIPDWVEDSFSNECQRSRIPFSAQFKNDPDFW